MAWHGIYVPRAKAQHVCQIGISRKPLDKFLVRQRTGPRGVWLLVDPVCDRYLDHHLPGFMRIQGRSRDHELTSRVWELKTIHLHILYYEPFLINICVRAKSIYN